MDSSGPIKWDFNAHSKDTIASVSNIELHDQIAKFWIE